MHEDFPERDDKNWMKHTVATFEGWGGKGGATSDRLSPGPRYTLTDEIEYIKPKKRVLILPSEVRRARSPDANGPLPIRSRLGWGFLIPSIVIPFPQSSSPSSIVIPAQAGIQGNAGYRHHRANAVRRGQDPATPARRLALDPACARMTTENQILVFRSSQPRPPSRTARP